MVCPPIHRLLACCVLPWLAALPLSAAKRELARVDRFPVSDGKRLVIDAGDLDVHVRAADVREVEVQTDLRIRGLGPTDADAWIAAHTPTFADTPDQLLVRTGTSSWGFLGIGHLTARARLLVVTPSSLVPDITTTGGDIELLGDFSLAEPLHLRTSEGTLSFQGAAGALDLRSASGNASLTLLRPLGRLTARTSSGRVILTGGAREVQVDTASGDVDLANLSGSAVVETSTGRLQLHWDRLETGATVVARSSSGRVELTLPAGTRPGGTLTTTTGTIHSNLPGTLDERGQVFRFEGNGPALEVETASSAIVVLSASSVAE